MQDAIDFLVRSFGYYEEDDIWEPPDHITRSALLSNYRQHAVSPNMEGVFKALTGYPTWKNSNTNGKGR